MSDNNTKQKQGKTATIEKKSFSLQSFSKLPLEDKISYGVVLILILLVYSIRSNFLSIPFERDEGIYAYFGKLLLEGKIPYIDFYEQKFPGLFYFYALIVKLFGDTIEGMHRGFVYMNIISLILLFFATKKLFSPFSGVITATTFAILSLTPSLSGFTIQSEHLVVFFTCLALFFYSFAKTSGKWLYYLLMGLAMGSAFMSKTSGIFLVAAGGLVIISDFIFNKDKKNIRALITHAFVYGAGVIAVVGIFFLLIYVKGAFDQMIFWTLTVPKKYVGQIKFEDGKKYFEYAYVAITSDYKIFWQHAYLGIILVLVKTVDIRLKLFALLLFAFSAMTIVPGYYFYGHYWIQTVPGVSMLAGLAYYSVITILNQRLNLKKEVFKFVYLGVFLVLTTAHLSKQKDYYFHPFYNRILRTVYGNNPFPETMEIANYINKNAKPTDEMVVMGSEPQLYFYTKKTCPSRHAYFSVLVFNIPEHKEWQREFVRDVEKAKPKYFIFYNHPISLFVQPNTDRYVFDWANKYLMDNYKTVGIVDMPESQMANYVWGDAVNTFKPVGPNYAMVMERK